ncbi:MAG: hypothetical protein IJR58_00905 [Lachnospiraceae bacterium]|nr:hypothetical protein [Lachnospiraceae bacterium]
MKETVKKIPLLLATILTALATTFFGTVGRFGAYATYRYTFRDTPVMALFFMGLADKQMPFVSAAQALPRTSTVRDESAGEALPQETAQAAPANKITDLVPQVQPAPEAVTEETGELPASLPEDYTQPAHNLSYALDESTWDEATRNKYGRIALLADPETGIVPTQYFERLPSYSSGFETVDATYFRDALFIGDSRTVGLSMYVPDLNAQATFYAKTSMSVAHVMEQPFAETPLGVMTVPQALQGTQFQKIYVALGINELGSGSTEHFVERYQEVIEELKVLQPDAIIYICAMMHVSQKKDDEGGYVNNAVINDRNNALSQLADNEKTFYIDMNEATDDASGVLQSDLTFDGVHLKAVSYDLWYRYLLDHAIVKDY